MNNNIKRGVWVAAVLLGCLGLAVSAQGASFDCGKAGTKVEHLICDNPEISKLDDELGKIYSGLFKKVSIPSSFSREQRTWLMIEREACVDAECLKTAYRNRIDELKSWQIPGSFITVLDKDKPLCTSYKRYVEHEVATKKQYGHNTSPMCQRTFGEGFPEFSPVKWREIQPKNYPELAVQAYRYINYWPWDRPEVAYAFTDKQFQFDLDVIKLNHLNGWFSMWLGEADISNTGHKETLLKVEADGQCGELTEKPPRWQMPVMVVDATGKKIDTAKSEWILGSSVLPKPLTPPQNFTYIPGIHENALETYDVFSRDGNTYFDRIKDAWVVIPYVKYDERFATYSVYQITYDQSQLVCRFKFKKLNY